MVQSGLTERLLQGVSPTAAAYIVTVYGDVVVPRGEELWMGSLIEVCARVGIRENLVRTAVSRLVAAGHLEGERVGRRSFYRLAPAARTEFARAARLLYAPEEQGAAPGWRVVHAPGLPEDLLRREGFGRMSGDVWVAPDRGQALPGAALVLRAVPEGDTAALAACWDLEPIRAGYAAMIARFEGLADALPLGGDALIARLLLVHAYRAVLLRDPRLPAEVLPKDWPGHQAGLVFRNLYNALSPAADAGIARLLEGADGPLPEKTPRSEARLAALI